MYVLLLVGYLLYKISTYNSWRSASRWSHKLQQVILNHTSISEQNIQFWEEKRVNNWLKWYLKDYKIIDINWTTTNIG